MMASKAKTLEQHPPKMSRTTLRGPSMAAVVDRYYVASASGIGSRPRLWSNGESHDEYPRNITLATEYDVSISTSSTEERTTVAAKVEAATHDFLRRSAFSSFVATFKPSSHHQTLFCMYLTSIEGVKKGGFRQLTPVGAIGELCMQSNKPRDPSSRPACRAWLGTFLRSGGASRQNVATVDW